MKTRCTLLVENLQPTMLRTQVQRLVKFEARMCGNDDRALYRLIVEQAKLQHKFHTLNSEEGYRRQEGQRTGSQVPEQTDCNDRSGCLSCKGPHWIKDCPKLTETQRKEVLDRLHE
ncbi:hypothetical protein PHMEG_00011510 [Phytophthora megakarya]|uniref:Uncharacterized protein n=1 Tax=Phytophthora megakarya TaxID=4795 RepID=A0A225WBD2_9STRA|nr:hypothetical protein PHMEG_00011510 [Phytophthora megakarya]